ncbi:hypothetical protein [Roseobacter sp. WL0113]|uniref:Uncharacterized protein n=1 Tax=Roseobacter sinensis TaxID=2931391 RepID=A0ABT3BGN8_9RHOB|nr:hypothetical protein [Roseobacter sp. WL0113]MCV3272705.1 hypothetical protein [Roseobacter sp. WL0113]
MSVRSSSLRVTFLHPFSLADFPDELPAGDYEVLIQEQLLRGQGFETYQRTATHMTVPGRGDRAGWMELHTISERDLNEALSRDQGPTEMNKHSEAALSPQEDLL